jgi:hypothetical protein
MEKASGAEASRRPASRRLGCDDPDSLVGSTPRDPSYRVLAARTVGGQSRGSCRHEVAGSVYRSDVKPVASLVTPDLTVNAFADASLGVQT